MGVEHICYHQLGDVIQQIIYQYIDILYRDHLNRWYSSIRARVHFPYNKRTNGICRMAITKEHLAHELLAVEKKLISTRTLLGQATLDAQPLNELREGKVRLEQHRDALEAALLEYDKRQKQKRQQVSDAHHSKLLSQLTKTEAKRLKAASKIDAALASLEAAYIAHEALVTEIIGGDSKLIDGPRPDHSYRKALVRSAMWKTCPTLSSALGIAFTPGNKRNKLAAYRTPFAKTEGK